MLKKLRIGKILFLIVVIVVANLYFGCTTKIYNTPDNQTQAQIKAQDEQAKSQDAKIKALEKEVEDLKKQKEPNKP
jgi:cell division protein FtsB